jgi:hypothetical protein
MKLFLFLIIIGAIAWFYWCGKNQNKPSTVQEVIGGNTAKLAWDGLTQNGSCYRVVVEVEPINLDNASADENKAIWMNFLMLINTLSLPYTLITQSQLFEMKDYTDSYGREIEYLPPEYSGLQDSAKVVQDYLTQTMDQGTVRDFHGYVIFEYDSVVATLNMSGDVSNLLEKIAPKKEKISEEEKTDLASQILDEAVSTLYGFCEQIGMRYQRLDNAGVWNYNYQTLQRELSPQARMIDALRTDSFKRVKQSMSYDTSNG